MTISERIFQLFEVQKKKQADLARALGVRQGTITNWKQARVSPASEHLEAIADFFGVSVDYLVTGREPQHSVVAQGIFGNENSHNVVTINGTATLELSEFETELLQIFGELSTRQKNALLSYAYELKEGKA